MSLPTSIQYQLNNFLKPRLTFNPTHQQYTFDDHWLINVSEDYFKKEALTIVRNINEHLKVGKDNKHFLSYLLQITEKRFDWYQHYDFPDIRSFYKIAETIISKDYTENLAPDVEKYSQKDIIENIIDFSAEITYYADLRSYSKEFDNYSNTIDYERVKLHYVLELHYEYVQKIAAYIDSLLEDCERVYFSKFDFDTLPFIKELKDPIVLNGILKKCKTSLTKVDVAHLFYFLVDEKMLVFDQNERQNYILVKKFIEENFTYKDDDGDQKNIVNINKEFTKLGFSNKEPHRKFIDKLIATLEERRANFK